MNRLLISTAIAGLLALSGPAFAQPGDHGGGHEEHGGGAPHGAAPAGHPAPQAHAAPARPAGPPPAARGPENHGADNRGHDDHRAAPAAAPAPNAMRGPAPNNAMRGPAPNNAMRGPAPNNAMRGPAPNNAMRGPAPSNRGGRQNFSSYQRNFSAPHHYHAPTAYRRPNGWYAHRWTYGQILPSLFWAPDYWLNDFNDYGLASPPPGTVWVRDGDDALLIDRDSGEIIQVEYSVFY